MSNVFDKITVDGKDGLIFWCPGCKGNHRITIKGANPDGWEWNGDLEKPTTTPSILVQTTRMTEKGKTDHKVWAEEGFPKRDGKAFDSEPVVCHSFVNDGQIRFLNDCTHELAGQTVDIPNWE